MSDVTIGQVPDYGAQRDAIHMAVVPVTCEEQLLPGQHVSLVPGTQDQVQPFHDNQIGIVDPFLKSSVPPGERFWLLLYPKTITSLRHDWTHPAFTAATEPTRSSPADKKSISEEWLRVYVRKHCHYWSDELDGGYDKFLGFVRNERWIYYYGDDCHCLSDVEDADDLFHHLSVILDRRIDESYFAAFTCSC